MIANPTGPLVWDSVLTNHKGSLASTNPKDKGSALPDPLGTGPALPDPLGAALAASDP
jgi:hypothetical protein